MLVVDANVVFDLVLMRDGFTLLEGDQAVAPHLLWPEVRSALHVARWRRVLESSEATAALKALESAPVRARGHRRLGVETWRIADALGWSKTYDAEYLALASLLDVPLATFDRRVERGAERLGIASYSFVKP